MEADTSSLLDRVFAITIAWLAPGLVPLFAAATVNATVRTWFEGAQNGPTLAGLLFVVLGALSIGFVVTAIRYCVYEHLRVGGRCLVGAPPALDESKRREHAAEYNDLRLQHYYHYLAYANLSVALPLAAVIWKAGTAETWTISITVAAVAAVCTYALATAACDAVRKYDDRRVRLLGLATSA